MLKTKSLDQLQPSHLSPDLCYINSYHPQNCEYLMVTSLKLILGSKSFHFKKRLTTAKLVIGRHKVPITSAEKLPNKTCANSLSLYSKKLLYVRSLMERNISCTQNRNVTPLWLQMKTFPVINLSNHIARI